MLWTGCSFQPAPQLPTPLPTEYIPTAIALTVGAPRSEQPSPQPVQPSPTPTATLAPSLTPRPVNSPTPPPETPSVTAELWTATPLSEDLQPPADVPAGAIQILSPGPGSRIASPFLLKASVRTAPEGVVRIELLGEDGRLLMREVQRYSITVGNRISLGREIAYGISAAAETGRLQIGVEDEQGRLVSQASTDLILLSLGEPDIYNPVDQLENIVLTSPRQNALIQGGVVRVAGLARTRSSQPLLVEIQTSDGKIVGTRQVSVETVSGSTHGEFEVDIPYTVTKPTRARLMVWEPGERIPGIVHLSSVEVLLSP